MCSRTRPPTCSRECRNADNYVEPDPNVAPFAPWPDPPAGYGIRIYPLAGVPDDSGRFGRIFRCSTLMINYLDPTDGPRDPSKLSPHHHDDFEQISLQLDGDYVHHMRTPWSVNMADWRDDEHMHCASPAVAVIPPPIVHTSQAVARHAQPTRRHLLPAPPRLLAASGLGAERRRVPDALTARPASSPPVRLSHHRWDRHSARFGHVLTDVSSSPTARVPKNNRERDLVPRTQLLPLGVHRRGCRRAHHGIRRMFRRRRDRGVPRGQLPGSVGNGVVHSGTRCRLGGVTSPIPRPGVAEKAASPFRARATVRSGDVRWPTR